MVAGRTGKVGLDGGYRFSPGPTGLPDGWRGYWAGEQTLGAEEHQAANNQASTTTVRFEANDMTLEFVERDAEAGLVTEGEAAGS